MFYVYVNGPNMVHTRQNFNYIVLIKKYILYKDVVNLPMTKRFV